MTRSCVARVVLLVSFGAALSSSGCASGQSATTPTVSPAAPTATSIPAATPTRAPAETPIRARVTLSPVSGPPGTEVVAVVTRFPAGTEIELGLGQLDSDHDVVSRPRTPSDGPLAARLAIPETAEPGEEWVVVVATEDGAARGVSNAFQVSAPPTPTPTPTPSPTFLLPDVQVLPAETIFIEVRGDQRVLRFATSFANVGEIDLLLFAERDPDREVVRAIQTVVTTSGEEQTVQIGEFVFHPDHTHFHVEDFAQYELWSYPETGATELLMSQEKVGFCMFDYAPYDLTLPNAPQTRQYAFEGCSEDIQGLSVGWVDTYLPEREGQSLDITGLPDGRYQLRMIANPASHMMESSYDNNEAVTVIEISGNDVQIVEE